MPASSEGEDEYEAEDGKEASQTHQSPVISRVNPHLFRSPGFREQKLAKIINNNQYLLIQK